jgi:hypothetical protein
MKVIDVLNALKHGELSNSHLSEALLDPTTDRSQVFNYINRAIVDINNEFNLNESEVFLTLQENVAKYSISAAKVIKIIGVFRSDGVELSLNGAADPLMSVYIPSFNNIEYYGLNKASATTTDFLSIIYLKEFDKVVTDLDDISLPTTFLECITSYVGYLAQHSLGIADNTVATGFKVTYLESISKVRRLGLIPDVYSKHAYWLTKKGFV